LDAVALGYFLAGELITARTVVAAALVVGSVFLILSRDPTARSPAAGTPAAGSPAATKSAACAMLRD
jgi:hypothetical protein